MNMFDKIGFIFLSAFILLLVYLLIVLLGIFSVELNVCDNVLTNNRSMPSKLKIAEIDTDDLYLIDEIGNNIIVIDENENVLFYDFDFEGSVHLTDVDENKDQFTVYFTRVHMYYTINRNGDIIDEYPLADGTVRDELVYSSEYGEYSISNWLIWAEVNNNDNRIYSTPLLFPVVLSGLIVVTSVVIIIAKKRGR